MLDNWRLCSHSSFKSNYISIIYQHFLLKTHRSDFTDAPDLCRNRYSVFAKVQSFSYAYFGKTTVSVFSGNNRGVGYSRGRSLKSVRADDHRLLWTGWRKIKCESGKRMKSKFLSTIITTTTTTTTTTEMPSSKALDLQAISGVCVCVCTFLPLQAVTSTVI